MGSTARFLEGTLLGVALGVGLSFLVFRKSTQSGLKDLWPTTSQPVPPHGVTRAPGLTGAVMEATPPTPPAVQPSEHQLAAAGHVVEPEVQVPPEVIEEPPTGVGWEPSTAPAREDEITEETVTPIPSEMEAYASIEVEPLDAEGIPVWAEIPSPEVEVQPDVEAAVEELQAEDVMVQEQAVEEPQLEEPQADEGAIKQPVVDELVVEEAVEQPVVEEPVVEELQAEEAVAEAAVEEPQAGEVEVEEQVVGEAVDEVEIEAPPGRTPADDLKARIEETRRRIRRELEQPFVIGGGAPAEEPPPSTEAEPTIGEALAVEPSPEEQPAPETQESTVSAAGEADFTLETEGGEPPSTTQGSPVDYDAMRSRIEETRGRLKAKAFDAMMTGESALLARDPEGVNIKLPSPSEVDGEIVQTIDDTLREEET